MTIDQFRTKIREINGASTNDWSDASLIRDLNSEASLVQIGILRDRGVLEFDDSNYEDIPIATFAITQGTRSYKILEDELGNKVITIHKVGVLKNGVYVDVPRVQLGEGNEAGLLTKDTDTVDVPSGYYEVGASVTFVDMPNTTTGKVWIDRDISFATTSDTTKVLGLPTQYHNLIAYRTAINYDNIDDNRLQKALNKIGLYQQELQQFEENRRSDESVTMSVERRSGL